MYKDLKDYKPKNIEFVVDESIKEQFPMELDFNVINGVNNVKDAIKLIGKDFTATFPENEYATRKLDKFEIDNIREEYCVMTEQELPKLVDRYLELKQMLKDADDAVKGKQLEINRYAHEVSGGVKESRLNSKETFQIAISGYYLTYTYDKSKNVFVLAKAFKINDPSELWANDEKNREAMLNFFGIEFPDIEQYDNNDNLPFEQE